MWLCHHLEDFHKLKKICINIDKFGVKKRTHKPLAYLYILNIIFSFNQNMYKLRLKIFREIHSKDKQWRTMLKMSQVFGMRITNHRKRISFSYIQLSLETKVL